jgi:hypothetical protein
MHIIFAVTDNGSPALTRYKRLIVNVKKDEMGKIDRHERN